MRQEAEGSPDRAARHRKAAGAHERAADLHDAAADRWDADGKDEHAERDRAELQEREAARLRPPDAG
jgi:hypothetical protein